MLPFSLINSTTGVFRMELPSLSIERNGTPRLAKSSFGIGGWMNLGTSAASSNDSVANSSMKSPICRITAASSSSDGVCASLNSSTDRTYSSTRSRHGRDGCAHRMVSSNSPVTSLRMGVCELEEAVKLAHKFKNSRLCACVHQRQNILTSTSTARSLCQFPLTSKW